jgi:flagellar biosynthesis component FlhA
MIYLKMLMSPIGKLLALIFAALATVAAVYSKARYEGAQAEKQRSKELVKKVQKKMDKETQKEVTNDEVRDRLKDGTF